MSWGLIAAAAAPYVMSMFQDKPSMPGAPAPVKMTDRSGLLNQILDSSFNPQNQIWVQAQERTMDNVNRALGRRGALGSSLALQLQNNASAELAKNWIEGEASRRASAFEAATGYDRAVAGIDQANSKNAYDYAMAEYQDKLRRNQNQIAGISGLVNAGVQGYNQYKTEQRFNDMMAKDTTPTYYGTPSPTYSMPDLGSSYASPAPSYSLGGNYGF